MNELSKSIGEASAASACMAGPLVWQAQASAALRSIPELTGEEKVKLEQLLSQDSVVIKAAVEKSRTPEELTRNLILIARPPPSAEPERDAKQEASDKLETTLAKVNPGPGAAGKDLLKASLKHIIKTLKKVKENPKLQKNRRIPLEAFDSKKFITGVPGATEFLEAVGFRNIEERKKQFLEIDSVDLIDPACDLVAARLQKIEDAEREPPKPAAARKQCSCGFWGDEKTDGLCSKCYAKKYAAPGAAAAAAEEKEAPFPCSKGCGFYGQKKFKGMCSSCFSKSGAEHRKDLKRRWRMALVKIKAVRRFRLALRPVQSNKSRCWTCGRKLGITGIECRCGYVFCGAHRYPYEHSCEYDYKKAQKAKLQKEVYVVKSEKFDKIDE